MRRWSSLVLTLSAAAMLASGARVRADGEDPGRQISAALKDLPQTVTRLEQLITYGQFRRTFHDFACGKFSARENRKVLNALAVGFARAAHPTCDAPEYRRHGWHNLGNGRYEMRLDLYYYGGITGRQYDATVRLVLDTSQADWQIERLSFSDDNRIPANDRRLSLLRRRMNEMLEQ